MDKHANTATQLILWFIAFFMSFALIAYHTIVLSSIWDWFIVPAGYGAKPLPFSFLVGILYLKSTLFAVDGVSRALNKKDEDESAAARAIVFQIVVAVALSFIWAGALIWRWVL